MGRQSLRIAYVYLCGSPFQGHTGIDTHAEEQEEKRKPAQHKTAHGSFIRAGKHTHYKQTYTGESAQDEHHNTMIGDQQVREEEKTVH